ncbi:MAG: tRNA (adenosine(37)-N6)-threonylcarbamoyltransferase complex dimerization subunit type 1 TsaB [Alphaproteobacteria bacterium]|nr:tRNA (adenosine(37)-N6)-threonylcarbamoyltransferase complex dimerization subunit type 1 TsaB [Alphaproteobacteria bacterium]
MIILAFDCAGAACSVAVVRDGTVLARNTRALLHGQAEVLVPMIQATLASAGLGYRDLDAIATTLGPGSFTGLRAGIATARGLALATGLPTVGISTLEAAAHAVAAAERRAASVMAAIDTRRDDLFVQVFDAALVAAGPPRVATAPDAATLAPAGALVLTGDATRPLLAALQAAGRTAAVASSAGPLDAAVVARLGAARLAGGGAGDPLRPVYLRAPDVTPMPARRR